MGENQGNDVENHSQKPKSGEDGQGPKGHEETSETMNRIEAKLDLQQFARLEVEIAAGRLREEMERHVGKLRKDAEGHKREIKSQNWKGVLAILGALGLLGVGGWYAAWDYLQDRTEEAIDQGAKAIQARLDEEFQTPRIQKLMADTVTKESARLLRENVVPEVEKLREDADALLAGVRSDTTARMAEFGHFVDGLQEQSREDYERAANDLKRLDSKMAELDRAIEHQQKRNRIVFLGDVAITQGARPAYDIIVKTSQSREESLEIRMAANAQVYRVKDSFLSGSRIESVMLDQTVGGTQKEESQFSPCEFMEVLAAKDQDWKLRAKAAQLLSGHRKKGVPEALLRSIEEDPHLEVVKNATMAWLRVTGFKSPDIFGHRTYRIGGRTIRSRLTRSSTIQTARSLGAGNSSRCRNDEGHAALRRQF
jgi:hypothetical protein